MKRFTIQSDFEIDVYTLLFEELNEHGTLNTGFYFLAEDKERGLDIVKKSFSLVNVFHDVDTVEGVMEMCNDKTDFVRKSIAEMEGNNMEVLSFVEVNCVETGHKKLLSVSTTHFGEHTIRKTEYSEIVERLFVSKVGELYSSLSLCKLND